jgi:hypothetical protein
LIALGQSISYIDVQSHTSDKIFAESHYYTETTIRESEIRRLTLDTDFKLLAFRQLSDDGDGKKDNAQTMAVFERVKDHTLVFMRLKMKKSDQNVLKLGCLGDTIRSNVDLNSDSAISKWFCSINTDSDGNKFCLAVVLRANKKVDFYYNFKLLE